LLKDPRKRIVESLLERHGFTPEEIAILKKTKKFIFLFDGFDELSLDKIDKGCSFLAANALYEWNVQLLLTCRSQHLVPINTHLTCGSYKTYLSEYEEYSELSNSATRKQFDWKEIFIMPCVEAQIIQYLHNYASSEESEWKDWGVYYHYLETIPGLKNLVQTPLILKIVVAALPTIERRSGQKNAFLNNTGSPMGTRLTRADVYAAFTYQWFEKEQWTLISHQFVPHTEDKLAKFSQFSMNLANQMFVESKVTTELFQEREKSKEILDYQHCPVKRVNDSSVAFIHKSIMEYFTALHMQNNLSSSQQGSAFGLKTSLPKLGTGTEPQKVLEKRALNGEPGILQFLGEMLGDAEKENLQKIVYASRDAKQIATASSNAMSILNAAGKDFSGQDFSGICIPNADLTGASLNSTNFTNADLTRVGFKKASMKGTILSKANLTGVEFAEGPDLAGHKSSVTTLYHSKDGKLLASGGLDSSVRIWENESSKCLKVLQHKGDIRSVVMSADTKFVYSATSYGVVYVWDRLEGVCTKKLKHPNGVVCLAIHESAINPSSGLLVTGCYDRQIRVYNLQTLEVKQTLTNDRFVSAVLFAKRKGELVLVSASGEDVDVWNLAANESIFHFSSHMKLVTDLSNYGHLLASGSADKSICIFTLEDGKCIRQINTISALLCIAFRPDDGSVIASGHVDTIIRLWDVESGSRLFSFY